MEQATARSQDDRAFWLGLTSLALVAVPGAFAYGIGLFDSAEPLDGIGTVVPSSFVTALLTLGVLAAVLSVFGVAIARRSRRTDTGGSTAGVVASGLGLVSSVAMIAFVLLAY